MNSNNKENKINIKDAKKIVVSAPKSIRGEVNIPPDKSISHRALFINALSEGEAQITNYLEGVDTWCTINCLRALGVEIIHEKDNRVLIKGIGHNEFKESNDILNVGTSATTMRFLTGLIAADPILTIITGVTRTINRPMKRVIEPISRMGATILGRENNTIGPLVIHGGELKGIEHKSDVSSSEVKTTILLAGLRAKSGKTIIDNPLPSRDHTERMLIAMGHDVLIDNNGCRVTIEPLSKPLKPLDMKIPGEISAAVYWIVLGLVHPDCELTIKSVCVNPLRTGLLEVLKKMGANIEIIENEKSSQLEPIADIRVKSSKLHGTTIEPEYFPTMADEFPGFALAASLAEGETIIKGAGDLRNKKSDRIKCVVEEFSKLGAKVFETEDGMRFEGVKKLIGSTCWSHGDHRLGNSLIVSGLVAEGETCIDDVVPVSSTSYPNFWDEVQNCCGIEVIKRVY